MMHSTCLNPSVSLRCRASRSLYFDDPTYFSDTRFETSPLLIASSFGCSSCCCCCCCCVANSNSTYSSVPRINPSFICNGLRQSTLIQFSPSKRLTIHGRRSQSSNTTSRFSSRNDSGRSYYCNKLYSLKEKMKLGEGRYACWSYEDKKNEQSFSNETVDDYVNEVELLLDLLTEEVGLGKIGVRDRKQIEKKDRSNISSKTKTVNLRSVNRDKKCDTKVAEIRSGVKQNRKLTNERRTSVAGANHEQIKQGSSSSSYYSVASTGEYGSDNNVVVEHDDYLVKGESSSEYKDDQKLYDYSRVYDEKLEENVERQHEFGERESEILTNNATEMYYGNQEWRKKSEKKLHLESSQSQSQHTERNIQQHSEKTDAITDQSQSGMKGKTSSIQRLYIDTESKLDNKGETADFTSQNRHKKQSNVILGASETHNFDRRMTSSSSSSFLETRMKHREENSTGSQSSDLFDDRREETHQRVDQLTSLKELAVKSQQISDTRVTNIENTSVSHTQSDIRTEKQELHLESSTSSEKRQNMEDNYSSSWVETVVRPAESTKAGKKISKASSFHVGMTKEASSSYKALKLNPESNIQETGARISSADEQQKSSGEFVGDFFEKAKHELSVSEGDLACEDDEKHEPKSSGENGSGNLDQKAGARGPSDELWHETVGSVNTPSDEPVKLSGRSLWNVIGDVVRLRWGPSRSETHTPKSAGPSNQSTSSDRWFSGHEPDESSRKDVSTPSSSKDKQDSPLLKPMSPLVIEASSISLPAVTSESTSVKNDQNAPKPLTDASGSGRTLIVQQPVPSRRKFARTDQVSKDRFDEWEEAYTNESKQRKNDELFMREALLEAKKAADIWEVPVGAVLVHDGKIIARGYNLVEELRDSTAHAEMVCIREASDKLRSWRLSGATLYVTLEPCPMCAGAILQARIDTVVWGAPNKLLGADGSWIRLFPGGDGGNVSDKLSAPVHPFHPNITVRRGVLSSECADAMQQFFQLRRRKKEKKPEAEASSPPTQPSCLPISHRHNSKLVTKLHDVFNIMFCL